MENQHKQITEYRDLSQAEIDLMNRCKSLAEGCGELVKELRESGLPGIDQRWVSIGATDLQKGFMAIIRGIARPTTF